MGKKMWIKNVDDELEVNYPGCMGAFIHVLDHNWHHNVKKKLLHKIHGGKSQSRGLESSKYKLLVYHSDEEQSLLDDEETRVHDDDSRKELGATTKKSMKARIKSLLAASISNEERGKRKKRGFHPQPYLQRTYSIHHLEPSDHDFEEWAKPIIFLPTNVHDGGTKPSEVKQMKVTEISDIVSEKCNTFISDEEPTFPSEDNADILQILKVDKESFRRLVQDTDESTGKFPYDLPASNVKARLTKSGSFPLADSVRRRSYKPSTLKDKQNEIWLHPKGDKLVGRTQAQKCAISSNEKDLYSFSGPLFVDSDSRMIDLASSFVFHNTMTDSAEDGSNEGIMPTEESEQREKTKVEWIRSEKNNIAETPEDSKGEAYGEKSSRSHSEIDEFDLRRIMYVHRRSSSLNESLDRYAGLLKYSSRKEEKLLSSRSLKLGNEYEISPAGHGPISFRRMQSLAHLDSYSFLQNAVSNEAKFSDWPIGTVEETSHIMGNKKNDKKPPVLFVSTENEIPPSSSTETESRNEVEEIGHKIERTESATSLNAELTAQLGGLIDEGDQGMIAKDRTYEEVESGITPIYHTQPPLVSDPEKCFLDVSQCSRESEILEGLGCNITYFDEEISSIDLQRSFNPNVFTSFRGKLNTDNSDVKDDSNLQYVRDILDQAGFLDGFPGEFYSLDQPLNSLLFEEVESLWHHHPECPKGDVCYCCLHRVLFDLVNEALLQIYDRSVSYYPKALSSSCHICPLPVRHHLLDKICASISALVNLKPKQRQSLDGIVGYDLAKDDNWMNLQVESECVVLELEDMIFDEMLDELICL